MSARNAARRAMAHKVHAYSYTLEALNGAGVTFHWDRASGVVIIRESKP